MPSQNPRGRHVCMASVSLAPIGSLASPFPPRFPSVCRPPSARSQPRAGSTCLEPLRAFSWTTLSCSFSSLQA